MCNDQPSRVIEWMKSFFPFASLILLNFPALFTILSIFSFWSDWSYQLVSEPSDPIGKNTHSPSSDHDAIAAAIEVRHEHLRTQVEDVYDSLSSLETQQASFQKTLDQITISNIAFQNTMTTQFSVFQSCMLDELRLFKSTHPHPQPSTAASPVNLTPTRPATSNTQPSFCSLFGPNTTYSGLGLLNHPPHLSVSP